MQPQSNTSGCAGGAAAQADEYAPRVPLRQAATVQAAAALASFILLALAAEATGMKSNAMIWASLQGLLAAGLARALGMDAWWVPMHALFAPALGWTLRLGLPPAYALAAFCLCASTYWGVSRTRVPLFLSSRAAAQALAGLLPRERSFTFLDLGSGLGGVLAALERARPAGRYYGIEAAPAPFLLGWLRAALGGRSRRMRWGDFQKLDLGSYDVVYAYLSPAAMGGLWRKARREMRPGSVLISNSFAVPGVPPQSDIALGVQGRARLLLWRM